MKKQNLKSLTINKQTISKINAQAISGGKNALEEVSGSGGSGNGSGVQGCQGCATRCPCG